MPHLGMTGRWPGFAAPLVALLVTLLVSWLTAVTLRAAEVSEAISGLVLLILLPAPLVVAVLWGGALLAGRPFRLAPLAALIWLATTWLLLPHEVVWQLAGNVAAGLVAGLACGLRWRLDRTLLVMALVLSPVLIWSSMQLSPTEQLQLYSDEVLKALEEQLPAGADEAQRAEAVAKERGKLDQMVALGAKIYPFVLALGILGQAAIVLTLVWLLARALGLHPGGWKLPPFGRWRVPFYVVWVLVAGLGLLMTRSAPWSDAGLNLVLLAAFVLSVQGLAVQFFVTGRMMSTLGRVIFWTVMSVFFVPLVLSSGVVLGLIDQWWDIRRLDREADDDNDGSAANLVGSDGAEADDAPQDVDSKDDLGADADDRSSQD